MHFVMMMKEVKEGMDTAQTGGVVKDPQVEGDLLVLTAEDGRGVALTMAEDGRGGARTMAGELTGVALIMAQMVVAEVTRGAAPTMTTSAVKLALVASAVKPALVASAVKPVLAMTGPPGMFGVIVILLRLKSIMLRHHAESPVCIV
jgi:hypothetical protein